MKKRALSFLMSVVLMFTLIVPATHVSATDGIAAKERTASSDVDFINANPLVPGMPKNSSPMDAIGLVGTDTDEANTPDGLEMNKTVEKDGDGYKITLDVYTTGSVREEYTAVPADIVLAIYLRKEFKQEYAGFESEDLKWKALQDAINNFLNKILEENKNNGGQYRVAEYFMAKRDILTDVKLDYLNENNKNYYLLDDSDINIMKSAVDDSSNNLEVGEYLLSKVQSANWNPDSAKTVILFTDAIDKASGNGWKSAYRIADEMKSGRFVSESGGAIIQSEKGAAIYTVGVFEGAEPTADVNECDDNTYGNIHSEKLELGSNLAIKERNYYMHRISSNHNNNTMNYTGGYYLAAHEGAALNEVFQSIYKQIATPVISLDSSTVIKDVVMPQFTMPTGTGEMTVQAVPCTGYTNDIPNWGNAQSLSGSTTVTIDNDNNTVTVTGFDFDANFVTRDGRGEDKSFHGRKLVITFKVGVKPGFLGGNGVYTNGEASGLYNDEGNVIGTFNRPMMDIDIPEVSIDVIDKNVYLLSGLTSDQLLGDSTIMCGNVAIDPGAENYGLESWQNAYVDISISTNAADCSSLTLDRTYGVSCTVSPNKAGIVTEKTESTEGNIYVFRPELTFKDSDVYYGGNAVYGDNCNKVSEAWKHGETVSTAVSMIGTAPELKLEYQPQSGVTEGIAVTTDDILVDAAVRLNGQDVGTFTTFVHQDCEGEIWSYNGGKPAFMLHVKTCTLDVRKLGAQVIDENISFIFHVKGNNAQVPINMDVVVQGNGAATIVGLPIGSYTVTEDENWSWRYKPENASYTIELTPGYPNNSVNPLTINNTRIIDKWLDGNAYCSNVFNQYVNTYR